jgi:hypothetical protein
LCRYFNKKPFKPGIHCLNFMLYIPRQTSDVSYAQQWFRPFHRATSILQRVVATASIKHGMTHVKNMSWGFYSRCKCPLVYRNKDLVT